MLYSITEYDENKEYNDDDVFYIDDRGLKFDPEKEEIVRPNDPRYDELPILDYYELSKKRTQDVMVDFNLISFANGIAEYEYFPDVAYDKKPGIISFDTSSSEFFLKTVSEYESNSTCYMYASHAQWKIRELYKKRSLPEKGSVMW